MTTQELEKQCNKLEVCFKLAKTLITFLKDCGLIYSFRPHSPPTDSKRQVGRCGWGQTVRHHSNVGGIQLQPTFVFERSCAHKARLLLWDPIQRNSIKYFIFLYIWLTNMILLSSHNTTKWFISLHFTTKNKLHVVSCDWPCYMKQIAQVVTQCLNRDYSVEFTMLFNIWQSYYLKLSETIKLCQWQDPSPFIHINVFSQYHTIFGFSLHCPFQ